MLDREKIVAVLRRRFPGSASYQVAAAANAIVGLEDEWEEIPAAEVIPCSESCYLAQGLAHGERLRVLRSRTVE
jgi:hypothetical protein